MENYLSKINGIDDLKRLKSSQLKELAAEIREFLLENISKTGGHLASNLGTVELTIALHHYLNSPTDKIIWDVGHQAYTHKILTGRKECFSSLRQKDGISGYPKCTESPHDIIGAGHSSTSISAAVGLSLARENLDQMGDIYAVIGDGALTGGMAFEALNHAGHIGADINVILNDNEMSIANNVGAISNYLSTLRNDPTVKRVQEDIEFLINKIPRIGKTVSNTVDRVKNALKYSFIQGVLFEEFGFNYLGPIDGHNIIELMKHFKQAEAIKGPVLLHVVTKKGKGYPPAEKNPDKFHGVGAFNIKDGSSKKSKLKPSYSQIFGETLSRMAAADKKIAGVTAAMAAGTGLDIFAEAYPERYYDVGIAEQHAITMSTGLARGGMKPVAAIYSTFLQRGYDQVIHDAALQNIDLTIAVDRAGIVGNDGETHQGLFDYSFLRPVPNLVMMAVKDAEQLQQMLYTAVNYEGPAVLRYPRGTAAGEYTPRKVEELQQIEIGKAEELIEIKEDMDLTILAVGSTVIPAQKAAEILNNNGYQTAVVDARFIKPLDEEIILKALKNSKNIITAEEQVLAGGFSSAVLELAADRGVAVKNIKRIGIGDEFVTHGGMEEMKKEYQLDARGILENALSLLSKAEEVKKLWPEKKD
ncbi:1-deoxy-D-xylulose-5-phosphate synthase [Halanaerobium congolense]|jgi:1-deoxy-D-xylulose-5-phosphate synthase|uniref:1-deoxy-D-xylulose-5-phosphate synthase n=1 Tax=Halanaerobium congolense TaxID=54121 RepID=A0A1G8HAD5_9FIRM|nr:1-deoxy-D-xylulose-5-phosphate synthase [Halanaerobium congolense]KXS50462.1 MAG: 1-deoxy-D-xylulose-5-phosphate synthase [Halanaerobium sp. T82-1]PUU93055.1 MAG: 1-deoxy-D-xylulose-5-phosphate synthase [Halanaerobium sp.]SDI03634.1 1-deoxy-D-xylulose-5-phosphate synthase [Halanaerobium congolense]SET19724.1 1-deoxy-D-xylulose-5-phosphate synthase [Halanaerobium congolense]